MALSVTYTFDLRCFMNTGPDNKSLHTSTGDRTDRDAADRDRERETMFRIRDRRRLDTNLLRDEALKSLERDKVEGFTADITKKLANPGASPIHLGEDVQFWVEKVGCCKLNYSRDWCKTIVTTLFYITSYNCFTQSPHVVV